MAAVCAAALHCVELRAVLVWHTGCMQTRVNSCIMHLTLSAYALDRLQMWMVCATCPACGQ